MTNAPIDPAYIAAVRNLKRLFKGDSEPDKRTIHEIYVANERDLSKVETNKNWLRENMTPIRVHKLAEVITADDNKTVVGVQISKEGKEALREALADEQEASEVKPANGAEEGSEEGQTLIQPLTADVIVNGGPHPSLTITLNINLEGLYKLPSSSNAHTAD